MLGTTGKTRDASPGPATAAPPEWWERLSARRTAWVQRHPRTATTWAKVAAVRLWLALAWILGLLIVVPDVRGSVRAYAGSFLLLLVWFTLARTKTISWRAVAGVFTASVTWAGVIGWATVRAAASVDLAASADGSGTVLAGVLEESGKLVPLVLIAVAAPGRVRLFAAADWALLGFAGGAGFNAFEDALRQAAALVTPGLLPGQWVKDYSLNPWASATFRTTDGLATAAGHHIWTATIAMSIGLSVALWRSSRSWRRAVAVAITPLVGLVVVAEHASFNAHNADPAWPDAGGEGFPTLLSGVWSITGHGRASAVLSVVFLVTCLLVDARRRAHAMAGSSGTLRAGVVVPGVGTGDGAAQWWGARLTSFSQGGADGASWRAAHALGDLVIRATAQWVGDLTIVLAAHGPAPDESRLAAVRRARTIATRVRLARCHAMGATTPGLEPAARRRFALRAAVVGLLALAACMLWGTHIAAAIGPSLPADGDATFLAGLFDAIGSWWDGLGTGGQILVGVGVGAAVVLSGGSLGVAFGVAGVATYGMDKAHGLATLTRDPWQATRNYLATTTPMDFLLDTGEFALTFAPGNFAGAAIARGGRNVVREFVTDPDAFLAARREVLSGDAGSASFGGHLDDVRPGSSTVDGAAAAQPPGPEVIGSGFSASERSAAEFVADQGRSVVLRPATGVGRVSDLLVDGVPYDVYSPRTGNLDRIVGAIAEKGSQVRGGGVVLDLSGSPLTASDVGNLLARVQGVTGNISDIIVMGG